MLENYRGSCMCLKNNITKEIGTKMHINLKIHIKNCRSR